MERPVAILSLWTLTAVWAIIVLGSLWALMTALGGGGKALVPVLVALLVLVGTVGAWRGAPWAYALNAVAWALLVSVGVYILYEAGLDDFGDAWFGILLAMLAASCLATLRSATIQAWLGRAAP